MRDSELEDLFESAGWGEVYEKHHYKLWISGVMTDWDENLLNAFLAAYSLEDVENLCFDELIYHHRIFKNIYEKNNLSFFPLN